MTPHQDNQFVQNMIEHAHAGAAETFRQLMLSDDADMTDQAAILVDAGLFRPTKLVRPWGLLQAQVQRMRDCLKSVAEHCAESDRAIAVFSDACYSFSQWISDGKIFPASVRYETEKGLLETAVKKDRRHVFEAILMVFQPEIRTKERWNSVEAIRRLINDGAGKCLESLANAGLVDLHVVMGRDQAAMIFDSTVRANNAEGLFALKRLGVLGLLNQYDIEDAAIQHAESENGLDGVLDTMIEKDMVSLKCAIKIVDRLCEVQAPTSNDGSILRIIRACASHYGPAFADSVNAMRSEEGSPLAYKAVAGGHLSFALELEKAGVDIAPADDAERDVLLCLVRGGTDEQLSEFIAGRDITPYLRRGRPPPSSIAASLNRTQSTVGMLLAAEAAVAVRRAVARARP